MKRIYTLLASLVFLFASAKAQQFRVSVSPEINLPTGNAASLSGVGFGTSIKPEIFIAEKYALNASGGYNLFITKNILGSKIANISALPVKLGLKHYSSPDFYIEAQAGTVFNIGSSSGNSFVWSPGFGALIKTGSSGNKLDFGLRYESWSSFKYGSTTSLKATSFNFIGLKLGYLFGI